MALSDNLETNASNPKRIRSDAGELEEHTLGDQIAADKYLRSLAAAAAARANNNGAYGGIRISRGIPPGTVGDC